MLRVQIIIGPLGSGKTTLCIQKLMKLIVMQKVNRWGDRKSRWVAIRNTYPDLETTTIPDFREIFTDDYGTMKFSNPPKFKMNFPLQDNTRVKSEVIFLALDQPEDVRKLRGTQFTGGWLNEIKETPKAVLDMLDSRIGRYPRKRELGYFYHCILGDCNAPDEDHWLADIEENTPENWKIYMQPGGVRWINNEWVLNPLAENLINLQDGYYKNLIQGKRKDWIDVNVANNFGSVKDGKPVHPDFSRDVHVASRPLSIEPSATLYTGIDFGRTPAACTGQKINGQWRILKEIVTEDMSTVKFAPLLKVHLNTVAGHPGEQWAMRNQSLRHELWGDPTGESMGQATEDTPFAILSAAGIEAYPTYTNDPAIRIGALDAKLCSFHDGQPDILIDPSCKVLIKALNTGYQFKRLKVTGDEKYEDKPNKNKFSHVAEALQYLLVGAGDVESVIGTFGAEEFDAVESEADFDGWYPSNVGV